MRYIDKPDEEPISMRDWKSQSRMYKKGTAGWHKFAKGKDGREYKIEFTKALVAEQNFVCCYCEQKLNIGDCHIDHLFPQSLDEFSEQLFDHNNLLCSCQLEIDKGDPRHCGNSKGNNIIPITPLMEDCETKFTYTIDGQIYHTCDDSKQTIIDLQLDHDKLKDLRESAIDALIYIDPVEKDELLPTEDVEALVEDYLKIKHGKCGEFYTTIKYLHEQNELVL